MSTTHPPISNEVALRIALAARVLPEISIAELIGALQEHLGEVLDEAALSRITVTNLKTFFGQTYDTDGEEVGEDATTGDIAALKEAVRILWGTKDEDEALPVVEAYQADDMPHSVRIAVASNHREQLDAHFGSCARYLIYQLSATDLKLIDIRSALEAELAEDRNRFRVNLIQDCHILYVVSIGGPAAAKVIQAGIYPMKVLEGGNARMILANFQNVIATAPPPWVAKILGVAASNRVKNYKASEG